MVRSARSVPAYTRRGAGGLRMIEGGQEAVDRLGYARPDRPA
jgi:hypothetical protein